MLRRFPGVLLLAVACQPMMVPATPEAQGGVALSTERGSYRSGSEIVLRLSNDSPGDIGYNLCHSQLQRPEGAEWIPAQPGMGHVCTMELRLLQRGGVTTYPLRLPAALPAGQYRFITSIEYMQAGARMSAVSNAFAVTP